ncbi:MAG: NFACT family protein [Acutalibacteraceae bacterium]
MHKLKNEIENAVLFSRVDKVSQPSKDEIVLTLRGKNGSKKLLLCIRANSPRIQLTAHAIENPSAPPMLCMLFRKHLLGAMIKSIRQHELDRILFIDFDASNEIGDKVTLTLCIEIMGKYSNIILVDGAGRIIDAVKRVDFSTSTVRQILPGLEYALPPGQSKCNLLTDDAHKVAELIATSDELKLSKAVLSAVQGISPIVAREIAYRSCDCDCRVGELTKEQLDNIENYINEIKSNLDAETKAYMISDETGKPIDYSFLKIGQYGSKAVVREYDSCSALLDDYYFEKDRIERTRHKGQELFRLVSTLTERTARKLNVQKEELAKCADRETLRIYAELINANVYRLEKGAPYYELENYYDGNKTVRISCDPSLSPVKNAQKYYKEYKKAQTAEKMLTQLIEKGEEELEYFKTVEDELVRSDTESELSSIREELASLGYVKNKRGNGKKPPKPLPPMEFKTTDGFTVLVGRNNIQNDRLSMKQANNHDMFLHIQKQPGSHVIIVSDHREISDKAIEEAAVIAAYYSSARQSSRVPIDYTYVKNLKKPNGAKPGYVIYHVYYTITVKPDGEFVEKLRKK